MPGDAKATAANIVVVLDLRQATLPRLLSFTVTTTLAALWLLIKGVDEARWQETVEACLT